MFLDRYYRRRRWIVGGTLVSIAVITMMLVPPPRAVSVKTSNITCRRVSFSNEHLGIFLIVFRILMKYFPSEPFVNFQKVRVSGLVLSSNLLKQLAVQ